MFLLSIIFGCGDGRDDDYFARVNGEAITVTEYEQQLADFIRVTGIKDNLQTRLQLLDQLINERLIIDNFRKKKFNQDDDFKRRAENIRSQLLLDEFRKQTFFDTISVAEQEITQRFIEYNKKVSARHLFARTREEADALYFQLQRGATFEELAKLTFQDSTLAHNGGYLGYFGRGEMDPAFEKAAFSMKVGELSSPVKTGFGYSIIKVEAGFQIPFTSESDFQNLRPNLIREIKRDKAICYAQQYGKQQAKKLAAEFDSQLVGLIFEKLSKPDVDLNLRKFSDEIKIDTEVAGLLELPVVTFRTGSWTVQTWLEKVRYTSSRQQQRIQTEDDLQQFILGLLVREQLIRQAEAKGIQRQTEFKNKLRHAIDRLIITQMRTSIMDTTTVPEEAARESFIKDSTYYVFPAEANVREILVASRSDAEQILNRNNNGESFASLASAYSLRDWARERGGELGSAPRYKFGALADTIFNLKPGEILGPLEIEGYFSLVQMIDKKPELQKTFQQAKAQIETELLWNWKKINWHNHIDELRSRASIEILSDKLRWYVFDQL